jgi:hypothetical protein
MRRTAAPSFIPATSTVFVDPATGESKIGSSRWSIFLVDIRNEAARFREVLHRADNDQKAVNSEFETSARHSFNAIHNVRRRRPALDDGVFRMRHRQPPPPPPKPDDDLFPAPRVCPRVRPTARSASVMRLLAPERLRTVYNVEPKPRDTFVVGGHKIFDQADFW